MGMGMDVVGLGRTCRAEIQSFFACCRTAGFTLLLLN
jgi:pyrimidine operon attenuation protein/uracil phosphoribosyltransferase